MATGITYEILRQGDDTILIGNAEHASVTPSIEDSAAVMEEVIGKLVENRAVTKIIFAQKQDYEYDYEQTKLLSEIAKLYRGIMHERHATFDALKAPGVSEDVASMRYAFLQKIIHDHLKKDPIAAFVELRREQRRAQINHDKSLTDEEERGWGAYVQILKDLGNTLEQSALIQQSRNKLQGYQTGERAIYRKIFYPQIKPDFMFTKVLAQYPKEGEEIASYTVGDADVVIFRVPDSVQLLYHLTPPEFRLPEDQYDLLETARKILSEHKPTEDDFVDPQRMRQVFSNVGQDLIEELAQKRNVVLTEETLELLTRILIRYTVGFGLIEVLLEDPHIQDITVNSPTGKSPIYIVHGKYEECFSNIVPTVPEVESWASKLRMISGRPLDEANPILDTDITIPDVAKARVAAIGKPLEPSGLAFAFRRHRDKPWTFPLFIKNKMMTPLAAGVLSFLIDGNRTFLIAGTRSAGKSSLLGSVMVEILRKYRIITIEDTLELPGQQLQALGYNLQQLKVASALAGNTSEIGADAGIRTTLRLGDSCLVVGEVRSTEAKALYEAMRVGALANVVAGTIHGDSPYGVFDRVVNDLEVPKTSFKATDIIVVANPVRSADGLTKERRVTEIAEIRKQWTDDPIEEQGFVSLMKYNPITDMLEPTDALINGESDIIKAIAGSVKEWAGNWEAVWKNIQLRADIKALIVQASEQANDPSLLEAKFVIKANEAFHRISQRVHGENGVADPEVIKREFTIWLERERHHGRPAQSPSRAATQ